MGSMGKNVSQKVGTGMHKVHDAPHGLVASLPSFWLTLLPMDPTFGAGLSLLGKIESIGEFKAKI